MSSPGADGLPPLPAKGTTRIDVFGPLVATAKWDSAKWDQADWVGPGWRAVEGVTLNAQISWGTDDNAGALSVTSAGSWSIKTYDPQRALDPSNTASPFRRFLVPGGGMRIVYTGTGTDEIVRVGFIDEVEFDMESKQGSIRATDGISLMSKAKVPAGLADDATAPHTLRARAQWVLDKAQVAYIEVEATPAGEIDPGVGLPIEGAASAWQHITTAAFDALYGVWLDRNGILRFRYFGRAAMSGVILGGGDGIPIDSLVTKLSMENVHNHITATRWGGMVDFGGGGGVHEASRPNSVRVYGDLILNRERANPNSAEWVHQLLQDRGSASVQYDVTTIRPQTPQDLIKLLDLGVASWLTVMVDSHGTKINQTVHVLGGTLEANVDSGWSAGLVTYKPAAVWSGTFPPAKILRTNGSKTREIYMTMDGGNFGKSDENHESHLSPMTPPPAPDGRIDERHEILMEFPIDYTGVKHVTECRLRFFRPEHDDENARREADWQHAVLLKQFWTESEVWPGPTWEDDIDSTWWLPTVTQIGQWTDINLTYMARAWAPVSAGGKGLPNYGLKIMPLGDWGGLPPQHYVIAGRNSPTPPYLLLKMEY